MFLNSDSNRHINNNTTVLQKNSFLLFNMTSIVFLLLLSIVTPITIAKYISSMSDNNNATIASFILIDDLNEIKNVKLNNIRKPGDSQTVTFKVANFLDDKVCEVALEYDFTVETLGNIPLTCTVTSSGATGSASYTSGNLSTYQYWSNGYFNASEMSTHTYSVSVSWNILDNDASYVDEVDMLKISLSTEQDLK